MPLDLTDDKSTLVQVMAWCRQATSHYLSQCWPRSPLPYGVTRPRWVKGVWHSHVLPCIENGSNEWTIQDLFSHNHVFALQCHITWASWHSKLQSEQQRKHQSSALLALCGVSPPVTGCFPSQRASDVENVSIACGKLFQPNNMYFLTFVYLHVVINNIKIERLLHWLPNHQNSCLSVSDSLQYM